ncbi:hypothetical protein GCM10027589_39790 [Actinocorallia lasiicapitis]
MTAEETPDFPSDVLEAGSALGEPVPDQPDPRLRTLSVLLWADAALLIAAVAAVGVLLNKKNDALLIAVAAVIVLLVAVAGTLFRLTRKLREPAVVLFADGLVHAVGEELVAVAWSSVKLAYLTPGKQLILQLENGSEFVLRAPVRNLATIESAVRKGVPRDRVRRGVPPKNLAAV